MFLPLTCHNPVNPGLTEETSSINTPYLSNSLSTIGLFFSQVRRGQKILPALGWSVVLLSIGLFIGGLISSGSGLSYENILDLSTQKIESLPALLLIFLGIIFLEWSISNLLKK